MVTVRTVLNWIVVKLNGTKCVCEKEKEVSY